MVIATIRPPLTAAAATIATTVGLDDCEGRFAHSLSLDDSMITGQELSTVRKTPCTGMTCSPAVHCSIKPASSRLEACSVPCSVPL